MASAKTVLSGSEGVATLPVEQAAIRLTEVICRFKYALAPSWTALAIWSMRSLPGEHEITQRIK